MLKYNTCQVCGKDKTENKSLRCHSCGNRAKKGKLHYNDFKDNPMFKHGKYGIRRIVFEVEENPKVCELCGSCERIEIHHKDKNQKNNNITNIMILCKSCHTKQHRGKEVMLKVRSYIHGK